jgi:DNA helicase HerA-like ATPase
MTPEDIQQIRVVVQEEISARLDPAVGAIAAKIGASEERTLEAIGAKIGASEERTLEAARGMQSEILRGLEAFARGNFARMHRIETSDADTNVRITALEERVLYLETRRPPQ